MLNRIEIRRLHEPHTNILLVFFNVVKTSLPIVNGNVLLGHVRLDNVLDQTDGPPPT